MVLRCARFHSIGRLWMKCACSQSTRWPPCHRTSLLWLFLSVRFLFSQYLEMFLEYLLGERIDVFSSLDGRQLVPYQAAVLRQKWSRIRMVFSDAFSLQNTAYRRANGGTTAPNVHEDVKPRFLPHGSIRGNDISSVSESCVPQEAPQHKVVVRRTFLEVETVAGLVSEGLFQAVSRMTIRMPIVL